MKELNIMKTTDYTTYTTISNYPLRDPRLSLKAKGLLTWMLSYPKDWTFSVEGIVAMQKDESTAVRSALNELEVCGYITRSRERNERGRFGRMKYCVYEYPQKILA